MPKYVSLKNHPKYNERWLQERIYEDPSLLGLGNLKVRDTERRQPSGGRLDMLLVDPETDKRYEVELQLGATDASHLIRTIEYWDEERKRYPRFEHIAVIVAEDVTSRFLNVIGLFNRAIPLIALQLKAVEVNDVLTLVATQVLDLTPSGVDDEDDEEPADRGLLERESSHAALLVCDRIIEMVRGVKSDIEPNYTKSYIGLRGAEGVQNFVTMWPKKKGHVNVHFKIPFDSDLDSRVEDSSLIKIGYSQGSNKCKVSIRELDLGDSQTLITELIRKARNAHFG
ncbi:MAG: hypothetical protein OXP69_02680 [Spirochaetaceae bacterium]|nr:hypothetical protein [Spirochaetaceae bacterium]